ncbi:hypothetical protein [Halorussus aquaticus]|uniref:Uncharacterized protein n=1 Tax=Halorussus aquaticus TaxID=2953748 RepID=A0ABD5Q2D5_9EURY|nr:hypothetical protein [Halorussus aquaticus]
MTRPTRSYAAVAVVLLLITATFAPVVTVSALPSVGSGPPVTHGVAASTAGNDATTTPTETTSTTTTATTTATGGDGTTTDVAETTTSTATSGGDGLPGMEDSRRSNESKSNGKVSSRVADIVANAGSGSTDSELVAQSRDGTTFVTVVLEAAPGRGDDAVAAARRSGGRVEQRYENLVRARLPAPAVKAVANASAIQFVRTPRRPKVTDVTSDGGLGDMNVGGVHQKGSPGRTPLSRSSTSGSTRRTPR